MRRLFIALLCASFAAVPAFADGPVPERRLVTVPDTDLVGGDLGAYFDTTFEACRAICLGDAACGAFTFNTRSNACFPKSELAETSFYEGALSAVILPTHPQVLADLDDRLAELAFLRPSDLSGARAQAARLPESFRAGLWSEAQLVDAAAQARAESTRESARRLTGAAITRGDSPDQWLQFALDARAIAALDSGKRRNMNRIALQAMTNAYLRAQTPALRATIAFEMAFVLEDVRRGRDMIEALRLSLAQAPRSQTQGALADAIGKYGFRITGHEVQAEAAAPRICAVFSEDLADLGVDYRPYVGLPQTDLAVSAEGRMLCVSGVQHGERYRLSFRQGLPSADGETLHRSFEQALYVPDRSPVVRFPGQAFVLPRSQGASVPIVSVNTDTVALRLRHISDRNILRTIQDGFFGQILRPWQENRFAGQIAEEIWTGTGEVAMTLNTDVTTQLPLGEALADAPAGLYALQARVAGGTAAAATQWFILTDLGISTMQGTDGLHVMVRSLGDATAKEGARVDLISEGNRVLATALVNDQGHAQFPPGMTRGRGAGAPAMVVVRDGDDFAFLSLKSAAFDLSDRGVEGRPPAPPVDLFLATDRGAYRAGEVIHLTALARDARGDALPGAPLVAILTRADGVEYSRHVLDTGNAGGAVATLPIGAQVPRGTWRLAVHGDPDAPALAEKTLLVEDFVPERLDLDIRLPEVLPLVGAEAVAQVDYLFGAPGADLPVSGSISLRTQRTIEAFPGYVFGRHDAPRPTGGSTLARQTTDATGAVILPLSLPQSQTDLPRTARVTLSVTEGSGRPVERSASAPVTRTSTLIGIRALERDIPEGGTATFDVIAIGPDDQLAAMNVTWTLNRVERRYQWFLENGRWNWNPITTRTPVAEGRGRLGDTPLRIQQDVDWGRYELAVVRDGGPFLAASDTISAGWFAPADAVGTPDVLELSLDAERYAIGDTAQLRVVPRAPGIALVSVLSNRVIHMETVALTGEAQTIPLEVTDDWGAGAYVTVQAIRPVAEATGRTPTRSLGLTHAAVDPGARALNVTLDTAPESAPRGPLSATLHVPGASGPVYASIAAVDVGILNLTGFDSPDPLGHYFGQRRLGMDLRDLYGRLIDPTTGAMGTVRSGGDAGAAMRAEAPPPTEEPVTLHSGLITLDAEGRAELSFDIPDFNGTVRLMAVVWSDTGVGQAEADVLVRDPVVALASLPRFLAPGDASVLRLELTHAYGPEGRVSLDIDADPGLRIGDHPPGVPLSAGKGLTLAVPITAESVGTHRIRLRMTTPDGTPLTKTLTLDVRRTDPPVARTELVRLAPGQSLALDATRIAGLGDASLSLTTGALARFDAPGLLAALDRYPYGCTEQVVSRAMPLLTLAGVSQSLGLADEATARARIEQTIDTVLSRQVAGGGFGLWGSHDGAPWLDAMVTDFLAQARAGGHAVPDRAFQRALDNLRNRVNYAGDFDQGGEDLAYALLVLAREGAASMGDLRYYADVKAEAFGSPFAVAQLGAALAAYGDQTRADRLFARAAARLGVASDPLHLMRADFGSRRRDAAGIIALANAAGSRVVDADALAELIRPSPAMSTQESLWMLMAAASDARAPLGGLTLDGAELGGAFVEVMEAAELRGQTLTNTGTQPVLLSLTASGVPDTPEPASAEGYRIQRFHFDLDGAPVDPSTVAHGTRLVTVLKVLPLRQREARLMVADPLPTGFEIDNPTLLRSGDIRALEWLELTDVARHTEFRADRFLAAVDWTSDQPFQLAYIVRAVSPGDFHHPAASVEDMYRPAFRASTEAGRVRVQ